jgi:hypothetical protein
VCSLNQGRRLGMSISKSSPPNLEVLNLGYELPLLKGISASVVGI